MLKVQEAVDCCKSLCSALCAVARCSYGPCARASSGAELVHGASAREAVLELEDARLKIAELCTRWDCSKFVQMWLTQTCVTK